MTIAAILVAVVLAFLAFKLVKGVIKFGLVAVILLVAYLVARHANHLDRWQLGLDGSEAIAADVSNHRHHRLLRPRRQRPRQRR